MFVMRMSEIKVPVSPGEMLDKITILRIKSARMTDPSKLNNVRNELDALPQETWRSSLYARADIAADEAALLAVNERLWVIKDEIRDKERAQAFDARFIELARAVYFENDERAAIKRRINISSGIGIGRGKILQQLQARAAKRTVAARQPRLLHGFREAELRAAMRAFAPAHVCSIGRYTFGCEFHSVHPRHRTGRPGRSAAVTVC